MTITTPVADAFDAWSDALDQLQREHSEHKARIARLGARFERCLASLSPENV